MATTLPYNFDTVGIWKVILKGMLGLELLVIVPGILYSLVFSKNARSAPLIAKVVRRITQCY